MLGHIIRRIIITGFTRINRLDSQLLYAAFYITILFDILFIVTWIALIFSVCTIKYRIHAGQASGTPFFYKGQPIDTCYPSAGLSYNVSLVCIFVTIN